MAPLRNATQDLLGGVVHGEMPLPPGLGVEPDLVFGGSTPFSYDGSFRRMWLQLKQNTPGSWLKVDSVSKYFN